MPNSRRKRRGRRQAGTDAEGLAAIPQRPLRARHVLCGLADVRALPHAAEHRPRAGAARTGGRLRCHGSAMTITLERVPASGRRGMNSPPCCPATCAAWAWTPTTRTAAVLDRSRPLSLSDPRAGPDRRLRPGPATARQRRLRNGRVLRARLPRGACAQAARAVRAHPGAWRIGIMANNAGALRFWRTVAPQAACSRRASRWRRRILDAVLARRPTRVRPDRAAQDAQQVRVATPADTPAILAVDALAWRIRARQADHAVEQGQCRVALDARRIVGYVMQDHGFSDTASYRRRPPPLAGARRARAARP